MSFATYTNININNPRIFINILYKPFSFSIYKRTNMSSPNNNKSPSVPNLDGAGDEKPRLTEEEKKQNHIASGR